MSAKLSRGDCDWLSQSLYQFEVFENVGSDVVCSYTTTKCSTKFNFHDFYGGVALSVLTFIFHCKKSDINISKMYCNNEEIRGLRRSAL